MANRAKKHNRYNHNRQLYFLAKGIVMLPTKKEWAKQIIKQNGVKEFN